METSSGKVWIVGAGPGDPELITIKGLKAIQRADVILYDALASTLLLDYAPKHCKRIYVGKRKSQKEFLQEQINQLIVFYAKKYNCVVRLKGGDPHVFGRGHEEMVFIIRKGIFVEVIPGISSAIAAPAACGIPLTKRGINESFWTVTGTLSTGEISKDITWAAQSTATVVILMGMAHLEKIASTFKSLRSQDEPMAVIQHATTLSQKIIVGTAADIYQRAQKADIQSPAVIVVGKVVAENQITHLLANRKSEFNC